MHYSKGFLEIPDCHVWGTATDTRLDVGIPAFPFGDPLHVSFRLGKFSLSFGLSELFGL